MEPILYEFVYTPQCFVVDTVRAGDEDDVLLSNHSGSMSSDERRRIKRDQSDAADNRQATTLTQIGLRCRRASHVD